MCFSPGTYCPAETVTNLHGTFVWNSTFAGDNKTVPCPLQINGNDLVTEEYAIRVCNVSLPGTPGIWNWSEPDISRCNFLSSTTRELQNLSTVRMHQYC